MLQRPSDFPCNPEQAAPLRAGRGCQRVLNPITAPVIRHHILRDFLLSLNISKYLSWIGKANWIKCKKTILLCLWRHLSCLFRIFTIYNWTYVPSWQPHQPNPEVTVIWALFFFFSQSLQILFQAHTRTECRCRNETQALWVNEAVIFDWSEAISGPSAGASPSRGRGADLKSGLGL